VWQVIKLFSKIGCKESCKERMWKPESRHEAGEVIWNHIIEAQKMLDEV